MKRNCLVLLVLLGLVAWMSHRAVTGARAAAVEKNTFEPNEIPYGPAPPFVPAGAQLAVMEGNPMAPNGR